MLRRRTVAILLALALPMAAPPAQAASKLQVFATNGLAIHGYDPVAYFTRKKPVSGKSQFTYRWQGATWRFASAANRDAFKADPTKYAPQYGGYCAFAVSEGVTAPTDPTAWTVYKGKLYLNFSRGVRSRWLENRDQRISDADKNWPGVLK
jgi:YHS domain-containing protein